MLTIEEKTLWLTQGDDAYLFVGAALTGGEALELRVYKEAASATPLFVRGQLPDGSFLINSRATMPLSPGVFFYTIVKLAKGSETVLSGPDKLIVTEGGI